MVYVDNLSPNWETIHCINPQRRQISSVDLALHIIVTNNALKIMVYPHHPLQPPGYCGCEGLVGSVKSGRAVLVSPVAESWGETVLAGVHPSLCLPWVLPDRRCSVPGFVFRAPWPLETVCGPQLALEPLPMRDWLVVPMVFPWSFFFRTSKCSWLCPLPSWGPAPDATKLSFVFFLFLSCSSSHLFTVLTSSIKLDTGSISSPIERHSYGYSYADCLVGSRAAMVV